MKYTLLVPPRFYTIIYRFYDKFK